jgi:hypothetical protein
MDSPKEWIEAGAYVGRQQAFAVIANKCSANQALALKQIKESHTYEELDLTWDEFCPKYAGISRSYADQIIRQYDSFGAAYFRLSELARISPKTFSHIEPRVDGDTIEVDGQKLALTPENAPAIRAAVDKMRAELRASQNKPPDFRTVSEYKITVDALVTEIKRKLKPVLDAGDRAALRGLASYAIEKLAAIRKTIDDLPEVPYYSGPH